MAAKVVAEPGSVVGEKYRVVRVIGTGGMGVVYEARHIELGQRVALKLLQSGDEGFGRSPSDEEQVQRFLREARASARLKSEHAAKVVDVGRQRSGAPFMVMELLNGKDLGEICAARPLPAPIAASYILQACEAVAEAHALGIVHRDLKPSNLFLTERMNGQPLVKVLDFGIAKMIRHDGDGKLTGTGAVMGSPQYMSPEQLRSSRDVDHRSDIWSLGVCLYELLSGRVPFEASAVPELYVKIMRDAPTPIEARVPGLPPALGTAIMRCLEKEPAARFGSVFELATALEPFAQGDSARGSASRISHLLSKTVHSDPPPALEQAALAAAAMPPRDIEATALITQKSGTRAWLLAGVFAGTAILGIGVSALYLLKTPPNPAQPLTPLTPTASEGAEHAEPAPPPAISETAATKLEPIAPTSSAAASPTPSARPVTAIRSGPIPKQLNTTPAPSAKPGELKTTFE